MTGIESFAPGELCSQSRWVGVRCVSSSGFGGKCRRSYVHPGWILHPNTMLGDHRLTFLVVEAEPGQGLSTRKLLIETAKHNVLTAHTAREGLEMLERFPKVDAIVVDVMLEDMSCEEFVKEIHHREESLTVIGITPNEARFACDGVKYMVNSHDPAELLKLLERLASEGTLER